MAYIVVATLKFPTTEDREKALPVFQAHRSRCLANEPGTSQFDLCFPEKEDDTLLIYEAYDDLDAFNTHSDGESMKQVLVDLNDLKLELSATVRSGLRLD